MRAIVPALGDSPFNYDAGSYSPARFLHYRQQVLHVLRLGPRRMLEIGPGDHTVTDFLRRKGVEVHTLDVDPELHPDFVGDIRQPLKVDGPYDLVLASEVLEHLDFSWFDTVVADLVAVLRPGGHLVLSLPYTTIRLFPPDARYGRFFSPDGRIRTHIPLHVVQPLLTVARAVYRLAARRPMREVFRRYRVERPADHVVDAHRWDLGLAPTTRASVRRRLGQRYRVVGEDAHDDTNCVFFVVEV